MTQVVSNRDGDVARDHRGLLLSFAFFNKVIETKRLGKTRSLGFDTLSATLRARQPAVAGLNLMPMGKDAPP